MQRLLPSPTILLAVLLASCADRPSEYSAGEAAHGAALTAPDPDAASPDASHEIAAADHAAAHNSTGHSAHGGHPGQHGDTGHAGSAAQGGHGPALSTGAGRTEHSHGHPAAGHAQPAQHDHAGPATDHRGAARDATAHARAGHEPGEPDRSEHHHAGHAPAEPAGSVAGEPSAADTVAGRRSDAAAPDSADGDTADARTLFARRILPILKSDRASSCRECHFSGVELRDYLREDQVETFAALKAGGLIDTANPDASKILTFIRRKPEREDELMRKVREQELAAFQAWIRAAVREPELLRATASVELETKLPPEVIRHARRDRVLASFIDSIWSEIGRCINCHSPERNRNQIGRNGRTKEDVDAISWIVPNDPYATLQRLVDDGNIDLDDPAASPVLTKPAGLAEHGGGPKFFPGSVTYRSFLTFLRDFAAVSRGDYRTADDLPAPDRELVRLGEQHLRVVEIPAEFSGMAMQVDLFRRDPRTGEWSAERCGTAFSRVNGKDRVWQNMVSVAAPAGSPRAEEFRKQPRLPDGAYLAKIYLDRDRKTERDPEYALGDREFVGQVEFDGAWKPGYQPPKIIRFPASDRR